MNRGERNLISCQLLLAVKHRYSLLLYLVNPVDHTDQKRSVFDLVWTFSIANFKKGSVFSILICLYAFLGSYRIWMSLTVFLVELIDKTRSVLKNTNFLQDHKMIKNGHLLKITLKNINSYIEKTKKKHSRRSKKYKGFDLFPLKNPIKNNYFAKRFNNGVIAEKR